MAVSDYDRHLPEKLVIAGFMMKNACLILLFVVLLLMGWTQGFCANPATWHGYIVDKQCADSVREDSTRETFVQVHTKDCALMCKDKGYSLYSQGRWFDFDVKGNNLALKLLQKSKRMRGFYVEVAGTIQNSTLYVQQMKEVPEPEVTKHNGVNQNGAN